MHRSIRLFVFALLVVTTSARAAAQSHGEEAPAGKKEGAHGTSASTKAAPHQPATVKKELPLGAPAHKEDVPHAPAPATTARAVAGALADAQARRRQVPQLQRNRQLPMPAEKRWALVWETADPRVPLVWPPMHAYRLSWDDSSETPPGAAR
jgi:hypothetical protein